MAEGKWEDDQNLKFIVFIDFYAKIFSSKHKRKYSILLNSDPKKYSSHCRNILEIELLHNAEAITKRLLLSSRPSPDSKNTSSNILENNFTIQNLKVLPNHGLSNTPSPPKTTPQNYPNKSRKSLCKLKPCSRPLLSSSICG
jgi:hypothetical protein